jgi:hypothetical protein
MVVWACEEIRLNFLLAHAGYDLNALVDGSEEFHGARIAEDGSWEEAVLFACCFSKSARAEKFVTRMVDDWKRTLTALNQTIQSIPVAGLNSIAMKAKHGRKFPRGFLKGLEVFGPAVMRCLRYTDLADVARGTSIGGVQLDDTQVLKANPFAELWLVPLPMRPFPGAALGRATTAASSGRTIAYPERLVTDDQRQIFATQSPSVGGVVVIDLSTSFQVTTGDLDAVLGVAPGATVIGYSHDPEWCSPVPSVPNAWLLAAGGNRCDSGPLETVGHGGNGVDGPVLRYALTVRKQGEPVIWITDGVVSDYLDEINPVCSRECVGLVTQHNIHVAESITDGVQLLASLTVGENPPIKIPSALLQAATLAA